MAAECRDPSALRSELIQKKEYYQLATDDERNFRDITASKLPGETLQLHAQQIFVEEYVSPNTDNRRLIIKHTPGSGKCWALGTQILMFNGMTKAVEDIIEGDYVMGDDSSPRLVTATCHGTETMYDISTNGGPSFTCNASHILHMYDMSRECFINVSVAHLLQTPTAYANCRIYRRGVEYHLYNTNKYAALSTATLSQSGISEAQIDHELCGAQTSHGQRQTLAAFTPSPLVWSGILNGSRDKQHNPLMIVDPYLLGYLLVAANEPSGHFDVESVAFANYLDNLAQDSGLELVCMSSSHYTLSGDNKRFIIELIRDAARHIPWTYQTASRHVRQRLLDGIAAACNTSIGSVDDSGDVGVRSLLLPTVELACDVYRLALSVGLHAVRTRHTVDVGGRFPSYQFTVRRSTQTQYYGFSVGGNHLYMLADFTVVHNSLTAIAAAQRFVDIYRDRYRSYIASQPTSIDRRKIRNEADYNTPSVFVIGYDATRAAFFRDLLGNSAFGYATEVETQELARLSRTSESSRNPVDMKRTRDFYIRLRRHVVDKSKGGFYKFFGYQKLVNALFTSDEVDLVQLERVTMARARTSDVTLEQTIKEMVAAGKVKVNTRLLEQFKDSFIICDEFHHTYNMNMKNNYGVALTYILDHHADRIAALFMSATLSNTSPSELVDALSYATVRGRITKREIFDRDGMLRDAARLREYACGKVSFLQETSLRFYPVRTFEGETWHVHSRGVGGGEIMYLKFTPCVVSDLQRRTIAAAINDETHAVTGLSEVNDEDTGDTAFGGTQTLYDIVFPNPPATNNANMADINRAGELAVEESSKSAESADSQAGRSQLTLLAAVNRSSLRDSLPSPQQTKKHHHKPIRAADMSVGLYKSAATRAALVSAPQEWRERAGIVVKRMGAGFIFGGPWLQRDHVVEYSTKYARLLDDLDEYSAAHEHDTVLGAKIMIYHDRVKMSGVQLIAELLRENDYLDEVTSPTDSSRCAYCSGRMGGHDKYVTKNGVTAHTYVAARFITLHSEIEQGGVVDLLSRFNSADNARGERFKIIVGSRILREGYEVKAVRLAMIMMLPISYPVLIQVLGRCYRKRSHEHLPPEDRTVAVRIYLSTGRAADDASGASLPEEVRWYEKSEMYRNIQLAEREINAAAVDAQIHRAVIMSKDALSEYFPGKSFPAGTVYNVPQNYEASAVLGNLYFNVEPPPRLTMPSRNSNGTLSTSTFTAYGYDRVEIQHISYAIKRLFTLQAAYTYETLWEAVRQPPFPMQTNPRLYSEDNFVIALSQLLVDERSSVVVTNATASDMTTAIASIFDPTDKRIPIGDVVYCIAQIDRYYVRFQYGIGVDIAEYGAFVAPSVYTLDLTDWARTTRDTTNYDARKKIFKRRYCGRTDVSGLLGEFDEPFYRRLMADIIAQRIDNSPAIDGALRALYSKTLALFEAFGGTVTAGEVLRYREVSKKFTGGKIFSNITSERIGDLPNPEASASDRNRSNAEASESSMAANGLRLRPEQSQDRSKPSLLVDPNTIVGYLTRDSVELYDSPNWISTSRVSMNRITTYNEAPAAIGYYENVGGAVMFKIRKPRKPGTKSTAADIRKLERGMVCATKSKSELLRIAHELGVRVDSEEKVRDLCEVIKNHLLALEIKYRSEGSRNKAFYLWFDRAPE